MSYYAIVVLYNKKAEASRSLKSLSAAGRPDLTVLVFDNSDLEKALKESNQRFCREHGLVYLSGEGNLGISRAYNRCIDYIVAKQQDASAGSSAGSSADASINASADAPAGSPAGAADQADAIKNTSAAPDQGNASKAAEDLVCFFDDDTDLEKASPSEGYFEQLDAAIDEVHDIYVPVILSAGKILSPCLLSTSHAARRFASQEEVYSYNGPSLSAINTGMAVRLKLYEHYRYDESIFLDGVDHHFLQDMKEKKHRIKVFPYVCEQAFSGDERPARDGALKRFEIFCKDYAYILKDHVPAYFFLTGKRALHLSLTYRDPVFIGRVFRIRNMKKGS